MFIFIVFPCKDITQISAEPQTFSADTKDASLILLWNKSPEGKCHQWVGSSRDKVSSHSESGQKFKAVKYGALKTGNEKFYDI